jgi:hypothetical protein
MSAPQSLLFRPMMSGDIVTGLSLGDKSFQPLKTFLRKSALDFHLSDVAKTYVLVEEVSPSKIWGYITIVCSEITLGEGYSLEDCPRANQYKTFAAIKIARLWIGGYVGKAMAGKWCISLVTDNIVPIVGCRFLIVDSKLNAISFYEKIGFTVLDTPENKQSKKPLLFLDLHRINID